MESAVCRLNFTALFFEFRYRIVKTGKYNISCVTAKATFQLISWTTSQILSQVKFQIYIEKEQSFI